MEEKRNRVGKREKQGPGSLSSYPNLQVGHWPLFRESGEEGMSVPVEKDESSFYQ